MLAGLCALRLAAPAWAGPNANGSLVLALAEGVVFTLGTDFCGAATATGCEDVVTSVDLEGIYVLHLLAIFPETASPEVAAITFGLDYPDLDEDGILLGDWNTCSIVESSTANWPAPGTGTTVIFPDLRTTPTFEVYWFAAYAYAEAPAARMRVVGNPEEGANFYTIDIPPVIDPVAALGSFGFFTTGDRGCDDLNIGACCFGPFACHILPEDACVTQGGQPFGPRTCDPLDFPCDEVTPAQERTWGRIKVEHRGAR